MADAKYKAEKPAGFPNADLYQLLAYCTVLDLPVGHLIYAKGNETSRQYTVRRAGTRLIAHILDLSLPPRQLLVSVTALAEDLITEQRKSLAAGSHDPASSQHVTPPC